MQAFKKFRLDSHSEIKHFHTQLKKERMAKLYKLGRHIEEKMEAEIALLLQDGKLSRQLSVEGVTAALAMTFEDYCTVSSVASKHALAKIREE